MQSKYPLAVANLMTMVTVITLFIFMTIILLGLIAVRGGRIVMAFRREVNGTITRMCVQIETMEKTQAAVARLIERREAPALGGPDTSSVFETPSSTPVGSAREIGSATREEGTAVGKRFLAFPVIHIGKHAKNVLNSAQQDIEMTDMSGAARSRKPTM